LGVSTFLLCWFYQSMSMGDLSTFYSLPQSLSTEVYSFPCRGYSYLLLGLHLGI
jgi:hypothetical protein